MFLKTFLDKYRSWKQFQKQPNGAKQRGFLPSQTYMKYPVSSTFGGKKVLNLGCGTTTYPAKNVVNLDGWASEGVNCIWDLSKTPLPFGDQEFDFIIANHVVEHIPNWFECFKELARVLKVGGVIEVWCPPVSSDSAFTYRDHINLIGIESFFGCENTGGRTHNVWANQEELARLGNVKNLVIESRLDNPAQFAWLLFLPTCLMRWCLTHLRNCVSETGYIFRKSRHD